MQVGSLCWRHGRSIRIVHAPKRAHRVRSNDLECLRTWSFRVTSHPIHAASHWTRPAGDPIVWRRDSRSGLTLVARAPRRLLTLLVAICVASACSVVLMNSGEARGESVDLPSIRLDHGAIGNFHWSVYAEPEPSREIRRPCLITKSSVGTSGAVAGTTVCGPVSPIPTLLGDSSGNGKGQRTVLAMAFDPSVLSVRLWLAGRPSRRIWLTQLSQREAAKLGLIRFRYGSRAFAGSFCLRRFATYGGSGDRITLSPDMGCPGRSSK